MTTNKEITVVAPINIALVKYWGKKDIDLVIPLNDSISVTVDSLVAKTNVKVIDGAANDKIKLNGHQLDISENPRFQKCLAELRRVVLEKNGMENWHCEVVTDTNFPISAGLASSAAGYSALIYAIGLLFDLDIDVICRISRLGSGSACRSVYGGYVHWIAGTDPAGVDCHCEAFALPNHWPSLRAMIVVVSDHAKHVSSSVGMQESVNTSGLLHHRVKHSVPSRISTIKAAILEQNFPQFAEMIMRDSNELHAICQDTYPPLFYMTDASRHIVQLVHAFNKRQGKVSVAYTFDAGPNCCLFMEDSTLAEFLPYLCRYCPNRTEDKFIRGLYYEVDKDAINRTKPLDCDVVHDSVQYIIISKLGMAPHKV